MHQKQLDLLDFVDKLTIERIGGRRHHIFNSSSSNIDTINSNTRSVIGAFGGRTRREEAASLKENNFAKIDFLERGNSIFPNKFSLGLAVCWMPFDGG